MAGDPFRDAFQARLSTHVTAAGITLPVADLRNTDEDPDAATGYIALEFPGGSEDQFTFGAPGANLHREQGQVTLRVAVPLGASRDIAEAAAAALRALFRQDRFPTSDSRSIKVTATGALGGGLRDGGLWAESIALRYETYNVG